MIVEEPQTGDVGLVKVTGFVGWLIDLGQRANRAKKKDARYEHAFMYMGNGYILEGQPGGAVVDSIDRYQGEPILWVRLVPDMTSEQVVALANQAAKLVGTGYSFLDYLALAVKRFGLPIPGVEKRVVSTDHMICSQIIVEAYRRSGVGDPFPGVPSGYVTPADYALRYGS